MNSIEKIEQDYKSAEEMGFYWSDALEIIQQIRLELEEVEKELQKKNSEALQEELGDVVHAWVTLVYFCGFNSNEIIEKAAQKFERRFKELRNVIKDEGMHHFKSLTRKEKLAFWEKAKHRNSH